jgi:hypothetical protein
MGSAMLISSGAAIAGPPGGATYGNFTATNGTITATCPAGATCGTAITGDGFFQRSVVIGTGATAATYYQTIVLPTGANVSSSGDIAGLEFSDENFVQQGGGTGIADQQTLFANGTANNPGNFTAATNINSGWAQDAGSDPITLSQTVDDPNTGFIVGFTLTSDGTNATSLNLTQSVDLDHNGSTGDKQVFDLRQLTASAAGDTSGFPLPGANGGTIAWVSGDIIQAVWMGQQVTASGTQLSGFIGYSVNHNQSTTAISYTDQTVTGPVSGGFAGTYDTTVFGAVPTF